MNRNGEVTKGSGIYRWMGYIIGATAPIFLHFSTHSLGILNIGTASM